MNATQRGRRADALFYDKVSRADLCNKVALLESEVEDLKDEIYGLHCTIASLEDENTKLRLTDVTGKVTEKDSDATVTRQSDMGTCYVEGFDDGIDEGMNGEWYSYMPPTWYLSCGHQYKGSERPNYCPRCGRKVVDE